MSWKNVTIMEEKIRFIRAWESRKYTVTELCKEFGISRVTGHRLIRRYREDGEKCFIKKSKAPRAIPHKTSEEIEDELIRLKGLYEEWGAKKLKVLLVKKYGKEKIPSETTLNHLLKKHGKVKVRKSKGQGIIQENELFKARESNELWSADYKGKFRLGNKRYCHALTICDGSSRFILDIRGHYRPTYKHVKEAFRKVFREYGLPQFLHTDNGVPFGSINSIRRYSRLSYWLIDQGVKPIFSDPGSPQQNGRHERMHKDLKASCAINPSNTMRSQQKQFDRFKKEYNEIRPHEALGMRTPKEVYRKSKRKYTERIKQYDYPQMMKLLKVTKNGSVRWGKHNWVYISRGAIGRYIGLEELGNGIWKVNYRGVNLGYFDEKKINKKEQHLKLSRSIV